ncbi:MAG: hypothetical protein NXI01_02850 [Gammaproteobacteria bacterium]|nr:hypothetical protein [Gammaproteobacteria bacterium]
MAINHTLELKLDTQRLAEMLKVQSQLEQNKRNAVLKTKTQQQQQINAEIRTKTQQQTNAQISLKMRPMGPTNNNNRKLTTQELLKLSQRLRNSHTPLAELQLNARAEARKKEHDKWFRVALKKHKKQLHMKHNNTKRKKAIHQQELEEQEHHHHHAIQMGML